MTNTKHDFVVVDTFTNIILDLSVNPLDSFIIYSFYDKFYNKGVIMRALQDGSNQTVLIDKGIVEPRVLTIDLKSRKVFWIDNSSKKFLSIDFEGNDLQTILQSEELFTESYFMEIFGEDIYWSNYIHNSILKTNKFGLNGTRLNYLVKSRNDEEFESIKIIDSSLQPNSINRCQNANCSHLCIPIGIDQYRCVCSQNEIYRQQICAQSVKYKNQNIFQNASNSSKI